ncbi:hypothetical protein, conserved [Trypanosoma brucei brucei TREU927]|uniref:Zinc finger protein n=1 Tax=Trypanosoma brucei brucei (strain 927/4 GUTat10.1) TaxID=185431 RepID=Q585W2_TRYB2|nr:hypothetical protein, conserved [Trypanosoma brucei brucei TREU927]AAX80789.1 hypothetical protein, conserved [Trypanosoma brucei]AAZ11923.1 hypothetical protein, conserved [Trypanosoma brucei brucei TREU927]
MTEVPGIPVTITCGICFGILHDPVTLSCKHSFCASCVLGRLECLEGRDFICLLCSTKQEHINNETLPKLVDNELRAYVKARVEGLAQQPVCQWCQEVAAAIQCDECAGAYCMDCNTAVHKNATKRHHTFFPLDDAQETRKLYRCCGVQGHEEYRLEFYCKVCESLCCAYCLLTGPHNGHESISVPEAAAIFRNRAPGEITLMTDKKERLEKKVNQLNVVTTRYFDSLEEVKKSIKERFSQLQMMVSQREKELLEALGSLCDTGHASLNQCRGRVLAKANAINESVVLLQHMKRGCSDYKILENRSYLSYHLSEETPDVEGLGFKFFEVGDFGLPQFKLFLDLRSEEHSKNGIRRDTNLRRCIPHSQVDDDSRPQSGKVLNVCAQDGSMIPLRTGRRFTLTEREGIDLKVLNSVVHVTAQPNEADSLKQIGIRTEQTVEEIARLFPEERGRVTWRVQLGKGFDKSFVGVVERTDTSLVPGGFYWKPTKLGVVDGGIGRIGQSFKELPVCCIGDVLTFTYSVDEGSLGINVNGKYYGNLVTSLHPRISPCFILYPKESLIVSC